MRRTGLLAWTLAAALTTAAVGCKDKEADRPKPDGDQPPAAKPSHDDGKPPTDATKTADPKKAEPKKTGDGEIPTADQLPAVQEVTPSVGKPSLPVRAEERE